MTTSCCRAQESEALADGAATEAEAADVAEETSDLERQDVPKSEMRPRATMGRARPKVISFMVSKLRQWSIVM